MAVISELKISPFKMQTGFELYEYIQSNGNQFIDTGVGANEKILVELKVKMVGSQSSTNILGVRGENGGDKGAFYIANFTDSQKIGFVYNGIKIEGIPYDNEIHEYKFGNGIFMIDGVSYGDETTNEFNSPFPIILFGVRNGGYIDVEKSVQAFYECKIYEDGNLLRHFIPCYTDEYKLIGLYEFIDDTFYIDFGDGAFTLGKQLSRNITKLNNSTISNITLDGVDYHFAKQSDFVSSICENSVKEPIIDMQIQGNSIQDGTPTPEAPVEIESVGVLGKNLFGNYETLENQLEQGTTATEYKPYGYTIPIIAKGENMVDMSKKPSENSSSYTYSNGVYTVLNSQAYKPNRWKIILKPNTKYIATAKSINASTGFVQISGYFSGTSIVEGTINLRDYALTNSFTTTDDGAITLSIYTSELVESLVVEDIQIREILETTNIYLKEPLRKIGNFADILDYKNKKVIRKIASEFINKVEFMSGDASTYKKFLSNIKQKPYVISSGNSYLGYAISNKFEQSKQIYGVMGEYKNLIQSYITTGGVNRCVYTFDAYSVQTIAEAQSLIGDGFEVCYVMEGTIEETIDIPQLSTFDGTTIFEIDTEIKPTENKIKYWKQI